VTPPAHRNRGLRAIQRGRSRPRVSVGDVLGRACVSVCDIRLEITTHSHHNLHEREQEFPDICTSLRFLIFRDRFGASRLCSLTLTAPAARRKVRKVVVSERSRP
jgi:hypothetical protein